MRQDSSPHDSHSVHPLAGVIDRLADLLPAQGPISIFIHHNTLHAFEHVPFEEAVEQASDRLGCDGGTDALECRLLWLPFHPRRMLFAAPVSAAARTDDRGPLPRRGTRCFDRTLRGRDDTS